MDLMGDIGAADQLISAREENKVLKAKVDELKEKVKELTLNNAQLLAEVEMYRKEAALPSFSNLALGSTQPVAVDEKANHFISSGNGVYPSDPAVTLPNVHDVANPLCCSLNKNDTVLGVGGADSYVSIMAWGSALAPGEQASIDTVHKAARVKCTAPVITIAFSSKDDIVAAGCMDGSVHLIQYKMNMGRVEAWLLQSGIKYTKYIKSLAFSHQGLLASASADGTVQVSKINVPNKDDTDDDTMMDEDANASIVEQVKSLHLSGAVECVCFVNEGNTLCLYERDTSYLAYFDMKDDFKMTQYSLNGAVTGGFDSHVSFAVMHLALSPNGKYLCAATDTSRNIIIEVGTSNIVRDLYGHKNDGFSVPRIAWSSNGQYIFGNTQEDSSICVWDIASAMLIDRLQGHGGQLRDIFSSGTTDTLVTSSYDKSVKVWLNKM